MNFSLGRAAFAMCQQLTQRSFAYAP